MPLWFRCLCWLGRCSLRLMLSPVPNLMWILVLVKIWIISLHCRGSKYPCENFFVHHGCNQSYISHMNYKLIGRAFDGSHFWPYQLTSCRNTDSIFFECFAGRLFDLLWNSHKYIFHSRKTNNSFEFLDNEFIKSKIRCKFDPEIRKKLEIWIWNIVNFRWKCFTSPISGRHSLPRDDITNK